jgi:putative SOS response-associated peptidase YedK
VPDICETFYEHRHITEKNKIPYLIGVRNSNAPDLFKPFTFGGLYDTWTDTQTGEVKESYSIITTAANPMMEIIHNSKKRMPLIIDEEDQFAWLEAKDEKTIKELMVPFPAEKMKAYPIHKKFSDPRVFADARAALLPQEYAEVDLKEFM